MKNYNVKFFKGHLLDEKTNQRILLRPEASFSIQGDDEAFSSSDPLNKAPESLSPEKKFEQLKKHHKTEIKKAFVVGTSFRFRIGVGRMADEDNYREYWFEGQLLEDLYMFKTKKGKVQLCQCDCVLNDVISGGLLFVEKVYGNSLNNLFSNVVTFYLPLQRSGSCNAFTTFRFNDLPLEARRNEFEMEIVALDLEKDMKDM